MNRIYSRCVNFFFFKQKSAYEMLRSLVGSEMCIRDRKIIDQKETTVLGASLFVQAACGNASSPEEAGKAINYKTEIVEPGTR